LQWVGNPGGPLRVMANAVRRVSVRRCAQVCAAVLASYVFVHVCACACCSNVIGAGWGRGRGGSCSRTEAEDNSFVLGLSCQTMDGVNRSLCKPYRKPQLTAPHHITSIVKPRVLPLTSRGDPAGADIADAPNDVTGRLYDVPYVVFASSGLSARPGWGGACDSVGTRG
jgi:hypothetical protein